MRRIIPLFFCLIFALSACNTIGFGVGVGGGSGGVGIGVSASGDFLRGGSARTNNQRGLHEFQNKDYEAARKSFEYTLKDYPQDPDATYYLGLTLIYLGEREQGFERLKSYRDSMVRIQQEVRWWAEYCRKKPEMTPDDIHRTLTKARADGYNENRREDWERFHGI